ncbi:FecR domain-containing protein [Agitococcus lubricus]|uniref:FecR family protein n=1 Tax=Agitococcus lubricus TaxID=1077255 RepID=A0A2T5IYX6_9GAMM|nr:FecR domain-containing protein [Agitococcus lubricus]PTQ89204.1 FecR family protein [Agitococcus lubricus]
MRANCQCQSRRQFLGQGLGLGLALLLPSLGDASQFTATEGSIWIDGRKAQQKMSVNANSRIKTGANGKAQFVIGDNAFLLAANSEVRFNPIRKRSTTISGLRLLTGGLLSVFGTGNKKLLTPTATIGIRGTGVYMMAEADSSYICLCYGKVDLAANHSPALNYPLSAEHHLGKLVGSDGSVVETGMQGHTDEELVMLEALVGRKVPF